MSNVSMIAKFIAQTGISKKEQNLTINDNVLLSYTTPIAKIINNTLVMSYFNYSSTTTRHYRNVIDLNKNKYDVIRVPNINAAGEVNLTQLIAKRDELLLKQSRARLNAASYDAPITELNKAIDFVSTFKPLLPLV